MIIPVVKSIVCADYEMDASAFERGNFSTSIEVEIGSKDSNWPI